MSYVKSGAFVLLSVAAGAFLTGLSGCGQPAGPQPGEAVSEEAAEGLNQLSEADRSAAIIQETCPVAGEPLGSMGKPIKLEVEGQEVFICCAGCEDPLRENPEEYLSRATE